MFHLLQFITPNFCLICCNSSPPIFVSLVAEDSDDDNDGVADGEDEDDDGDGVPDDEDEDRDTDGDGTPDIGKLIQSN